jgi:hypothetical protein
MVPVPDAISAAESRRRRRLRINPGSSSGLFMPH